MDSKIREFNECLTPGNAQWLASMIEYKNRLLDHSVKKIYFIHGTFVGNDALGFIGFLNPFFKHIKKGEEISNSLKKMTKASKNLIYEDFGNFNSTFLDLAKNTFEKDIPIEHFIWSSGNYHFARLQAAIDLLFSIEKSVIKMCNQENSRILFYNHSHAGQLLAIITLLLENKKTANGIFEIINKLPEMNLDKIKKALNSIRKIKLDIVNFGTPVRYKWGITENYRLLSIVNYRSPIKISGLSNNRDGDYIRHYGTSGTDLLPPIGIKKINDVLDNYLDKGRSISTTLKKLKKTTADIPINTENTPAGTLRLIDYKDNFVNPQIFRKKLPPQALLGVKSKFGHGVYTTTSALRFNFKIITEELY
jgi:hypothetical protein